VLKKYGIRVSRAYLATSSAEAVSCASRIKGEVVIKADVSGLAHRARYGLVKTGLITSASVKDASTKILRGANELIKKNKASQRLNGVIVAEQAAPGMEVLVGAVLDPIFGPTVTVGHGGVLTEVIDSVAMRVAPFTRRQAQQMLREVKGSEIWRDTGGADAWRELVDVVMKVQRMALDLGDKLLVIDINPVVVTPGSAIAVDAWIDVN
ncbi:MAG: acetate--CoA ligase family protein, partial [Verrucomicrobiota bacterium]